MSSNITLPTFVSGKDADMPSLARFGRSSSASGGTPTLMSPTREIHPVVEDDTSSQRSAGSATSSFAQFVTNRINNARSGATMFSAGVGGAVHNIPENINAIAYSLNQMATRLSNAKTGAVQIISPELAEDSFRKLVKLDESKLVQLLNMSEISKDEVAHYLSLVKAAENNHQTVARKAAEKQMRRLLYATHATVVADGVSIGYGTPAAEASLERLFEVIKYKLRDEANRVNFLMAITHSSFTNELETNRVLAYIGDKAVATHLGTVGYEKRVPVAVVNNVFQSTMSNSTWYMHAIRLFLDSIVRRGKTLQEVSPSILSTAYEAILGAIYIDGGIAGLLEFNEVSGWLQVEELAGNYSRVVIGSSDSEQSEK